MSDNLSIWNALSRTDPAHTKPFKRAGGFSGTALKPIWVDRLLTALFGPIGEGWGTDEPSYQLVSAGTDILVYCTVRAWFVNDKDNGTRCYVYGVGGDKVLSTNKYGPVTDDEAFKKAFTDAKLNAFKSVGVGADIHMGQFDDQKYVAEVRKEFSGAGGGAGQSLDAQVSPPAADKLTSAISQGHASPRAGGENWPQGPASNKAQLTALWRALKDKLIEAASIGDPDTLDGYLADEKALLKQIEVVRPDWWSGEGLPESIPGWIMSKQNEAHVNEQKRLMNGALVGANGTTITDAG